MDRCVGQKFSGNYQAIVSVDIRRKNLFVPDLNHLVRMELWDTPGQERFQSLSSAYYRGANACVLLYDTTSRHSFDALGKWRDDFLDSLLSALVVDPERNFQFLVLGTKSDLEGSVAAEDVQEWCAYFGDGKTPWFETSAKDNTNVEMAFIELAKKALAAQPETTIAVHTVSESSSASPLSYRGEQARANPRWIPDDEASQCMICDKSFRLMDWPHHCRRCGWVVCAACSTSKQTLGQWLDKEPPHALRKMRSETPQRVCSLCTAATLAEAGLVPPRAGA